MLKTVHAKLLVPILCAIILSSLITGIAEHQVISSIIDEAFNEDGRRSANRLRESVDNTISKAQTDLSALSAAPSVKHLLQGNEASGALVEDYITALVNQYGIYNSMTILNTDGIIVASTSGSTGGDRSDREYFQSGMKGEFHISEVEKSRQTGRLATFVSIPVHDADNSIIGVALAVINLEEFNSRYVAPISLLGNGGYAMIATSSGTVIGHRDEKEVGGMMPDKTMRYLHLIKKDGESAAFETTKDGVAYMAFAERSHYTDWYAIVVSPLSEFNAPTHYLTVFKSVLAVILVLLQAALIWFVVRGITKALSATVRYSEEVAKGSLDAALSVERDDEVGVLAQSLRVMVRKLKDLIEFAEKKTAEVEESAKTIYESIVYASKIQKNLLPVDSILQNAFSDYSVIWKPRDIVGGDIYWAKNFDDGTVLCVCDCTGHGTPGALLTMLVASVFESTITEKNHTNTAQILYMLDQKIASAFHVKAGAELSMDINDGCDLAVLFIAKDGSVTMSAGNTNVFVCDGKEVIRLRGQQVFVGDGQLKSKDDVDTHRIPANPANKFYIATDGLSDQVGGKSGKQFGFKTLERIALENHSEKQAIISAKIWNAFVEYQGKQPRRDDFQLVTFKP